MNKWLSIGIIVVLVVALAATGYLYYGKSNDLKTANTEIATQKTTIDGLNTDLTASKAETADFQGKLATSEATVVTLNGSITDLTGKNTKLTTDLGLANSALSIAQADLASTKSSLSSAQSSLNTAQTTNSTLTASLKKVTDPRHFATITELTDWLQKDDTNTNPKYANMDLIQKSYILQIHALRDGFIISVAIYESGGNYYIGNRAIVGNIVYDVSPDDDFAYAYSVVVAQPSHPDPLP